jgi:hypothetical protein
LRIRRAPFLLVGLLVLAAGGAGAQELALSVEAPPSLEPVAARIRTIDRPRLVDALGRAGLAPPPNTRITLLSEEHSRAVATPSWIVGQAFGSREIVIFPARVGAYPHDSLESVVWHEVVHLALFERAAGRPLPRWFHEGVAVSVEGWGVGSHLRLMIAAVSDPSLVDLNGLFSSDTQPESARAYLLAAALISDVRRRHGAATPGAIAGRVALGAPFDQAFAAETGETPAAAASHAWAGYRRWASWIPVVTGTPFVWLGILLLSIIAFVVRARKRARRRRLWDEEDDDTEDQEEVGGAGPDDDSGQSR